MNSIRTVIALASAAPCLAAIIYSLSQPHPLSTFFQFIIVVSCTLLLLIFFAVCGLFDFDRKPSQAQLADDAIGKCIQVPFDTIDLAELEKAIEDYSVPLSFEKDGFWIRFQKHRSLPPGTRFMKPNLQPPVKVWYEITACQGSLSVDPIVTQRHETIVSVAKALSREATDGYRNTPLTLNPSPVKAPPMTAISDLAEQIMAVEGLIKEYRQRNPGDRSPDMDITYKIGVGSRYQELLEKLDKQEAESKAMGDRMI